jgi:hypothetical protein
MKESVVKNTAFSIVNVCRAFLIRAIVFSAEINRVPAGSFRNDTPEKTGQTITIL